MRNRHKIILNMLQSGKLLLHETALELGVSEMTLRRDFRELEKQHLLMQVKNGAIAYPVKYAPESSLKQLNSVKYAIAKRLCLSIFPAQTIFIGTGTTCLALAQTISRSKFAPMTIITHSLPVASALFQTRHKVILLGGELRSSSMDLLGPITEKNLIEYQVEWLICGCDGAYSNRGFYTSDMSLSNLEKLSISISHKVAIITESSKFGRRSLTRFADPENVNLLVTDTGIKEIDRKNLTDRGIQLLCVPQESEKDFPAPRPDGGKGA